MSVHESPISITPFQMMLHPDFTGLELDASLRSSWLSMFMQNGLREGNEDVGA